MKTYIQIHPDGWREEVQYDPKAGRVSQHIRDIKKLNFLGKNPHLNRNNKKSCLKRKINNFKRWLSSNHSQTRFEGRVTSIGNVSSAREGVVPGLESNRLKVSQA